MEEKELIPEENERIPEEQEFTAEDTQAEEFDLEDILKEFADEEETVRELSPEEILEAVKEEVLEEVAQEEAEAIAQEETVVTPASGDTVRFEVSGTAAEERPVPDATIRLSVIPDVKGAVRDAKPIEDEEQTQPVQEETAEPYSEGWEPEYEQPIAEYVPPRPILFHPRSRLKELKRKLVAGPEKMYYALSEKGLGKLQLAIAISLLVLLVSAAATAMYAVGMVPENRMRFMVFCQFMGMLLSALLGSFQLLEGAADIFHKRFSLNSLLLFSFLLCCADGVLCFMELRVPCCAAFSLQVTMSLWSTYHRRHARLGQLDTMRKATHLDSLCAQENYFEEKKGILRGEGQVEDFMDTLDQTSGQEKVLSVYALVALCVSIAVGVAAGILHGVSTGMQVAAVTVLAAVPASAFITATRPLAILQRRLHSLGAVFCGWQGVKGLSGKLVFPFDHNDLFPGGTVKMNGVKFFGSRQPDDIVACATALISCGGGTLEPIFDHLLDSRNGMHYAVENFNNYGNGGIGGEVNGEPVLAGTLSFLKEMGVDLPEGIRVSRAVCVAIDGELCGVFAITYENDRVSRAGLGTLCSYRGLNPLLVSSDFMLTESFIRDCFDVRTKRMVFPEPEVRQQLREQKPEPGTQALALITGEGLAPFAYTVTGARALKSACTAGVVIHMVGGILGIVMMAVLAVLGATEYLTPVNMLLYELLWLIPGFLVTEWTRSV